MYRGTLSGQLVIEDLPGIGVHVSKELDLLDSTLEHYIQYPKTLGSGSGAELPLGDVTSAKVIYLEGDNAFDLKINNATEYIRVKNLLTFGASATSLYAADVAGGTNIQVIIAG